MVLFRLVVVARADVSWSEVGRDELESCGFIEVITARLGSPASSELLETTDTPLAASRELNFFKLDLDSACDCFWDCKWLACSLGFISQPENACDVLRKQTGMANNNPNSNEIVKIARFINPPEKQ